jgi:2,3-bisphosphoglycerate-independent phosphoglycerate mutase
MGNSEVGHLNIGAGRIVGQDLPRITGAVQTREFFKNPVFLEAVDHVKKNKSKLHLVGMVSGGGIHSLDEHLYALLGLAEENGVNEAYIHMFTDGRDTAEKVALDSIRKLKEKIQQIGIKARIATIAGRFYSMDRGEHWDQTEMTYQAMVNGVGAAAYTPEDCVLDNYNQNVFDEMIRPTVIVDSDDTTGSKLPVAKIQDNDAVIFFNFRPDRALQLVQAFIQPEVMKIPSRHVHLNNMYFATMTEYFTNLPVHVAFPPISLKNNLAEVVSNSHLTQFHIAESEKYAHVTSFFNGGVSQALPGEDRHIVESPNNTQNYSDHPDMSAPQLTDILIDKIVHSEYNFYVANFANPDMVGHTGNLDAATKAVKFIDRFLEKIMESTLMVDACLIITADHGNCEQMINLRTGEIDKDM